MGAYGAGTYGQGIYGGLTALDLTLQSDVYPDKVQVTVSDVVIGSVVSVTRRPAGSTVRTAVRGLNAIEAVSDAVVTTDAEQPFGVELTYILTVDELDLVEEAITVDLSGSKVALSDAISAAAAEVIVLSWPSKKRSRDATVFKVAGDNLAVTGPRGGFASTIELYTETDEAREALDTLLEEATAGILQIRQAGFYSGVDSYFAVLADDENRWSQDGSDERRIVVLDVVETPPWASVFSSSTFTLGDIAAAYVGQTYVDFEADYATLLDAARGDYS